MSGQPRIGKPFRERRLVPAHILAILDEERVDWSLRYSTKHLLLYVGEAHALTLSRGRANNSRSGRGHKDNLAGTLRRFLRQLEERKC